MPSDGATSTEVESGSEPGVADAFAVRAACGFCGATRTYTDDEYDRPISQATFDAAQHEHVCGKVGFDVGFVGGDGA